MAFLTSDQKRILALYMDTGRVVHVVRKRDGRVLLSLNGGPARPITEAMTKMSECIASK